MLSVCFWGVRGTIPCPGKDTVIYGGNTSCLEIRADGRLLIVDLGTGIRLLGNWLLANEYKTKPVDADIFISHTHWDHIMGFPVFAPVFMPSSTLRIHGPVSYEDDTLEAILGAQLSYRYWPVRLDELAARISYLRIRETTLDMGGGLKVITKHLNHPILCLGYRFEYQGKSIVTAFDTEPFQNVFPTDPDDPSYDEAAALEGEEVIREENERLFRFFEGADILIHDSQYTAEEYKTKQGWGHSCFEQTIDMAIKAGVKKLICFHHDPARTDAQLAELESTYRESIAGLTGAAAPPLLEFYMAREGSSFTV
jgi:phosphoribosyl 1,2-cyclic phosphodiesterase